MATYTSKQYANSPRAGQGAFPANMVGFQFEVSITANAANLDAFEFGKVPKGFRVMGACLEATDIDTNGSPTVTINVGDSGDADRLFAAATVGQTGTLSTAIATTGHFYTYTDDTLITGAIPTGPATGTTGTLYLSIWGTFVGPNS